MGNRNLAAIGKARFQSRSRLPVDHRDAVSCTGEVPGAADANDPRAENQNFHAVSLLLLFAGNADNFGDAAQLAYEPSQMLAVCYLNKKMKI